MSDAIAALEAALENDTAVSTEDFMQKFRMSAGGVRRLQINTGMSRNVALGKPGANINNFCLVGREHASEDLGKEVVCLVVAVRPKALDITDPKVPKEYFDPELDGFKRCMSAAEQVDSPMSGYLYGMEFLLYLKNGEFVHFFLGNKTAHNMINEVGSYVVSKTLCELEIKMITGTAGKAKGKIWPGFTTKIVADNDFAAPEEDVFVGALKRFKNQKSYVEEEIAPAPDANTPGN